MRQLAKDDMANAPFTTLAFWRRRWLQGTARIDTMQQIFFLASAIVRLVRFCIMPTVIGGGAR
jgi:hypothetical protein